MEEKCYTAGMKMLSTVTGKNLDLGSTLGGLLLYFQLTVFIDF